MKHLFAGTSRLAVLADTLPSRVRIGLAVLAGELAVGELKSSPNALIGRAALSLARRWYNGEPIEPDQIEQALENERGDGVVVCEQLARLEHERTAWLALTTVLCCVAEAYREAGQIPGPAVCEVRGDEFDYLSEQLRALSPRFLEILIRAATNLKREPNLSLESLKREALSQ